MNQLDLLDYIAKAPAQPVNVDPYPLGPAAGRHGTSVMAAIMISPKVNELQLLVLQEIRRQPGTYKQISFRLCMDSRRVQPRISELLQQNLIVDAGVRHREPEDRCSCIVWHAAEQVLTGGVR